MKTVTFNLNERQWQFLANMLGNDCRNIFCVILRHFLGHSKEKEVKAVKYANYMGDMTISVIEALGQSKPDDTLQGFDIVLSEKQYYYLMNLAFIHTEISKNHKDLWLSIISILKKANHAE